MIHHVSVGTNDYGSGQLVFSVETPRDASPATVGNGSHVAFAAQDHAMVDRFYAAAIDPAAAAMASRA